MTDEKAARLAAIRAANAARAAQASPETMAETLSAENVPVSAGSTRPLVISAPDAPDARAPVADGASRRLVVPAAAAALPPPPPPVEGAVIPPPIAAAADAVSPRPARPAAPAPRAAGALPNAIDADAPALALETVLMLLLAAVAGALAATLLLPAWLPGLSASLLGPEPKAYWYLARSSGLVAYVMLWLSMLLGLSMSNKLARVWPGGPTAFDLHQHSSLLALALALFHGLILLGDRYIGFTLVDLLLPFAATSATSVWVGVGQLAFYLLAVVGLSFYVKGAIGRQAWRLLHVASFAAFLLALVHGIGSGTDSAAPLIAALYWLSGASVLFFTVYRALASQAQPARA